MVLEHLTNQQEQLLSDFKSNLADAGLYTETTNDDVMILRFLRARRFDLAKAQKQFANTMAWRKEHDVENLYATFDPSELHASKRFYPRWTGRRDKQGLPLYVYHPASLSGPLEAELKLVSPDRRYQRIIALYEFMCGFVMSLCTHLPRPNLSTPVSSATTIIDFQDATLLSLWNLRHHFQEASALATSNYPETLSTTAIVNCPSFFPTIWGWVKMWFDEGTRTKFQVLGTDHSEFLLSLVDDEHLPMVYGGKLDWKYEDEPNLDLDAENTLGASTVPQGPALFVDGKVVMLPI